MDKGKEAALKKLREAYTRIGGAIGSVEQAQKRPGVKEDDLLTAHLGMAIWNLNGVRELIGEAGKLLK